MYKEYLNRSMTAYNTKDEVLILRRQITGKVANIKDIEKLKQIKNEIDK